MDEFRWIIMPSFLMLVLKFTAATQKYSLAGNEVTLPCEKVTDDQDKCNSATWSFRGSGKEVTVFEHGQILKDGSAKSDRLSVTANCSLVIKKVTVEDAGYYSCRQFNKLGKHQDAQVYLFIITMTEHNNNKKVTLSCSVSSHQWCEHTVKWLYEGKHVDEDNKDMKTSQSECSATVTFLPSFLKQTSKQHELFKCNVTNIYNKEVQPLTFNLQSSDDTTTTTTTSPTTIQSPSTTRNKWTSVKMNTSEETNNNNQTKQGWWRFIIVFVGFIALLIIVVAVIRWKRAQGNKTQVNAEESVSYVSISYIKKTNCKARVRGDDDDEGDAVTYSTVKAPSSSAGASADPSSLYSTIN